MIGVAAAAILRLIKNLVVPFPEIIADFLDWAALARTMSRRRLRVAADVR